MNIPVLCVVRLQVTLASKNRRPKRKRQHKIGRTHLMDATPLTLGQEFSAYAAPILDFGLKALKNTLPHLSQLALGGTAVGNRFEHAEKASDVKVADYIAEIHSSPFLGTADNKFEVISVNTNRMTKLTVHYVN